MIKQIVLGTLILVSGVYAADTKAPAYNAKPGFATDWNLMSKELRATNKQDAKIKKINKSYDKKYAKYAKTISPLRERLHKEVSEKSPNFSISRHLMEKLSVQETDLRMDQLKHRYRVSEALSKEQRVTFQALTNQYPDPDWYPDPTWYPNPEWRTAKTEAVANAASTTPTVAQAAPVSTPVVPTVPVKPLTKKEAKKAAEAQKKLEKEQKEEQKRQEKLKKKEESKKKRAKIKEELSKAASKEIEKLAEKQSKK